MTAAEAMKHFALTAGDLDPYTPDSDSTEEEIVKCLIARGVSARLVEEEFPCGAECCGFDRSIKIDPPKA